MKKKEKFKKYFTEWFVFDVSDDLLVKEVRENQKKEKSKKPVANVIKLFFLCC
jgi:hypothetical protein